MRKIGIVLCGLMITFAACTKNELESNDAQAVERSAKQQNSSAAIQSCLASLNKFEKGVIDKERLVSEITPKLIGFCNTDRKADHFPPALRNLPDEVLLAIINSELSEEQKVCILLLQDHLSEEVGQAATDANLRKEINAQSLADNTTPINTEGVSVSENNMLIFSTGEDFVKTMESLVNHPEEDIDLWEQKINFTSLRSHNNSILDDPDIDDFEFDQKRINDIWFESILNLNREFQIEHEIYRYSEDFSFVDIISISEDKSERIFLKRADDLACPFTPFHSTDCSRSLNNGNNRVFGKKTNQWFGVYSSLTSRTTYYRVKSNGKIKRTKADDIHLLIDQWHKVCYHPKGTQKGCSNPLCKSNQGKDKNNKKSIVKAWEIFVLISNKGELAPKICVCDFGRVHHWVNGGWNDDCHAEPW